MASKKEEKNILALIKNHHEILRECIEVVKDEDESDEEKMTSLGEFMTALKMHAKAEEQTLYEALIDVKDVRAHFLEAQTEHNLAEQLMEEIEGLGFPDDWNDEIAAKGKVLVEMVEHHAEEEEDEIFADAKEHLTRSELEELGKEYMEKCEDLLEEIENQPTVAAGSLEMVKSHLYPS